MAEVLSQDEIDQLLTAISSGEVATEEVQQPQPTSARSRSTTSSGPTSSRRTRSAPSRSCTRPSPASPPPRCRASCAASCTCTWPPSTSSPTRSSSARSPTRPPWRVINMDPLKGSAILEIDPPITFSIIDRLLRRPGRGRQVHAGAHRHRAVGDGGHHRAHPGQPARGVGHGDRPAPAPGQHRDQPAVRADRAPHGDGGARDPGDQGRRRGGDDELLHPLPHHRADHLRSSPRSTCTPRPAPAARPRRT